MATTTKTVNQRKQSRLISWSRQDKRLLSWHEVQSYEQDNPYIRSGYRPLTNSYAVCCGSLFGVHNQTVNIWSHLLGSLFYAGAGIYFWCSLAHEYGTFTTGDMVAFGCYFVSVVACLILSVGFHLFSNHSAKIHDRHLFLDMLGILGLILGSWIPGIYYGFYCDSSNAQFYWSLIGAFTTACASMLVIPSCRQQRWKPIRTLLFIGLGLAGILPMFYAANTFGIDQAHRQMGWGFFCLEGVFYISGVFLYASKMPERLWPGKFDIVGASHQLFHILVVLGAAAHLTGIVKAYNFNHDPKTRLCDVIH